MCRSIKTLRPPYTEHPTSADSQAAALQYVRKVAGMRSPSKANAEGFESAVAAIAAITDELLAGLVLPSRPAAQHQHADHQHADHQHV
ncbi:MAG: hypothetical protein JWO63_418 [Frankiales bacterium]|jgi:hypothetical protein|nr:hypothetical protein [Frankiales bacterium]